MCFADLSGDDEVMPPHFIQAGFKKKITGVYSEILIHYHLPSVRELTYKHIHKHIHRSVFEDSDSYPSALCS